METIMRRVRMAERQAHRRWKRKADVEYRHDVWTPRLRAVAHREFEVRSQMQNSIKARREDWELGPLAPRRDVPKVDGWGNYWGTISPERATLSIELSDGAKKARTAWCGGAEYLCLARGDRVIVTEGHYKDTIGVITHINKESMAVELANLLVNTAVPRFLFEEGNEATSLVPPAIPISAVRLVHPIVDEKTGQVQDRIIRQLQPTGIVRDHPTRTLVYSRIVPVLKLKIPWPKQVNPEYTDHEGDTRREVIEKRTFVPTLLRPPMPASVLDELRNPYSKFRTRHTPEYIAKIAAQEEAKEERKRSVASMSLPIQEFNRKQRESRRARGQPVLTDEMLEKIGKMVADSRAMRAESQREDEHVFVSAKADLGPLGRTAERVEVTELQERVEQLSLTDRVAVAR